MQPRPFMEILRPCTERDWMVICRNTESLAQSLEKLIPYGEASRATFGLQSLSWAPKQSLPLSMHLIDLSGILITEQVLESEPSSRVSWSLPLLSF